ncbi:MAG: DUF3107 domain-containing protein [Propionibacteriaceae bacterium]|nr:DUF3107 domain-containing protein [Propionibacteriaceae bacterium]
MEIKIGIQNVTREVTINVDGSIADIVKDYSDARSKDSWMTLADSSGRQIMIPASTIGYIEFGQEHARQVGFNT